EEQRDVSGVPAGRCGGLSVRALTFYYSTTAADFQKTRQPLRHPHGHTVLAVKGEANPRERSRVEKPGTIAGPREELRMDLARLGGKADGDARFRPYAERGHSAARVGVEHKELYEICTEHGERAAVVSGKLRHDAAGPEAFPAVGDWVAVQLHGPDEPAV